MTALSPLTKVFNMSSKDINMDSKIAILASEGFEHDELHHPMKELCDTGCSCVIVSDRSDQIRGWKGDGWSDPVGVDMSIEDALGRADEFDALLIPGGLASPDILRRNENAVKFTRSFFESGKPVGAICHGPQVLIECDVLTGREVTSNEAIKTDMKNAGARWSDQECVCDQALVTARSPEDLPAFTSKFIEEVREGFHAGQRTA